MAPFLHIAVDWEGNMELDKIKSNGKKEFNKKRYDKHNFESKRKFKLLSDLLKTEYKDCKENYKYDGLWKPKEKFIKIEFEDRRENNFDGLKNGKYPYSNGYSILERKLESDKNTSCIFVITKQGCDDEFGFINFALARKLYKENKLKSETFQARDTDKPEKRFLFPIDLCVFIKVDFKTGKITRLERD